MGVDVPTNGALGPSECGVSRAGVGGRGGVWSLSHGAMGQEERCAVVRR